MARFAGALRRAGSAVSPAELLDAARAVEAVGIEDRSLFRAALQATLAKDGTVELSDTNQTEVDGIPASVDRSVHKLIDAL